MSDLFYIVINMSLTANYVILGVILVRQLLKKSPKIISYILWSVVAFRLVVPFSFKSTLSLLPKNIDTTPIPNNIALSETPQINSGISVVDMVVNNSLPVQANSYTNSVNPLQIYEFIFMLIWVIGIVVFLGYYIYSILKLKRQLKNSEHLEGNIYEAKNLKTPFVLGCIKPKIYLPKDLSLEERKYICLHEQIHIYRKDYIIKSLGFLILAIHWFNPLVWISFILMNKDMEYSCDESVLKALDSNVKKSYAMSLVNLASEKPLVSRIAFGEGDVKGRVKNVLNYRKRNLGILVVSVVSAVVIGIGLMSNPVSGSEEEIPEVTTENASNENIDSNDKATNFTENNVTEEVINNYILVGESNPTNGLFYLGMSSEEALEKIYEVNLETDLSINLDPNATYVDEVLRVMEELENYDELMYELTVSDLIHLYFDKDKILKEVMIQQPSTIANYDDILNYKQENKSGSFYLSTMITEKFVNLRSTKDDLLEYYGEPDQFIEKPFGDLYIYEINQDLDLMFIVVGGEEGTTPFVYRISYGENYPVN